MRHQFLRVVAFVFAFALVAAVPAEDTALTTGPLGEPLETLEPPFPVPDYVFEERLPDGSSRDWGMLEFRGQVVVLTFWATWCSVCAKEMPKLDQLAAAVREQPVEVLAISIDDELDEAAAALSKRGHRNLRVLHDTQMSLSTRMGIRGVPTTFVVGSDGRALAVVEGPADWDSEGVPRWLRALAPARSPG